MNNFVAYIDLLAFSNHVRENTSDAVMTMNSYNTILSTKIKDDKLYPVNSYPTALQDLAKSRSVDSFDFFLPFSDAIFLMSSDCNHFISQLGNFVLQSFTLTSNFYKNPIDPSQPEKGPILQYGVDDNGNITVTNGECNYYPALFRGGLAYGEAFPVELYGIVNKQTGKSKIITGTAVVEAVNLEAKVKGPRLIFKKSLFDQLGSDAKDYCRTIPEDRNMYEILWPSLSYIKQNDEFQCKQELSKFDDLFKPAYNLWKAYNHTVFSAHYFCFVELIIASTIQFFDKKCNLKNYVLEQLNNRLLNTDLKDKIDLKKY